MPDAKPLTKLEAVNELDGYDHAYLTPEYAKKIAAVFGCKIGMQQQTNRPGGFKTLDAPGYKDGAKVPGYDAADLAVALCEHEGVTYLSMHGRGSRLHECCRALRAHLTQGLAAYDKAAAPEA